MAVPLDEVYLRWLYGQFASLRSRSPHLTYWRLTRTLFKTEFVWLIPNDDNRLEDGRYLRHEFFEQGGARGIRIDPVWMEQGCSFLEMVVALTRHLAFETNRESRWWFWVLMENLDLHHATDDSSYSEEHIQQKVDAVIWRQYPSNGVGGLFPMENPEEDQRNVELWYQMHTWLLDHDYV